MKPLLIGQAPSRTGDPSKPLTGPCGEKIRELFGISKFRYLRRFDRMNVMSFYIGKKGKGDLFDLVEAERRARDWMVELAVIPRPFVILFGKSVGKAFGHEDKKYFEWFFLSGESPTVVVPHPSPINRWWNERRHRTQATRFFRRLKRRHAL